MSKDNDYVLVSYKNPRLRRLKYHIFENEKMAPAEIFHDNKVHLLYGVHATGTLKEMLDLRP
jgi:hypothetical protein